MDQFSEARMTLTHSKWLWPWAAGLYFAAWNGNWLLSRKSIGASTIVLAVVWCQIALGCALSWWAYRQAKRDSRRDAAT